MAGLKRGEKGHDFMYKRNIGFRTDRIDLLIEEELLMEYYGWAREVEYELESSQPSHTASERDGESKRKFMSGLSCKLNFGLGRSEPRIT